MGKVSEQKKMTSGPAPATETLQALEAKREVLLEELQRVEKRILQVRETEPVPQSTCYARAQGPGGKSSAEAPPRSEKLKRLLRERFPAEGREERIQKAKEHPLPTFKIRNLTPEQIKYFAEDMEPDYDV